MLCGRKTRATGSGGSSERCSAAIHTAAPCRTGPMGTVGLFTCFLCGIVGVLFCHHCMCAQSCLTLCDPMDCSPPGYSVHGILQAKNTGAGCHVLLQEIFLTQELNLSLCVSCVAADSSPTCPVSGTIDYSTWFLWPV